MTTTTDRTADRHTKRYMVGYSPEVYELIVRMASDAGRPVNWEARRIAVLMARAAKIKGAESIPILPPVRD